MKWLRRHSRPRMRMLLVVLLLLVAGAIVNVAVAWGIYFYLWDWREVEVRRRVAGQDLVWWRTHCPSDFATIPPMVDVFERRSFGTSVLCMQDAVDVMGDRAWLISSGWPTRALQLESWQGSRKGPLFEMHVAAWTLPEQLAEGGRVLPLRVMFPGFAINTLFYAMILWGLFAAPFALRRRRRIKRGLCPKCAYPIGTSAVCTECGHRLPFPSR